MQCVNNIPTNNVYCYCTTRFELFMIFQCRIKLGFQNDTKRMKIGSLYNFPKLYNNSYKFACIQKTSDSSDQKPQFFRFSAKSFSEKAEHFWKVGLSFPNTAHCYYSAINQNELKLCTFLFTLCGLFLSKITDLRSFVAKFCR